MSSSLRDAAPDAWGRRVILYKKFGGKGRNAYLTHLDELTYLLESNSDRVGALDFQLSPTSYVPRNIGAATLDELSRAAEQLEAGIPLSPALDRVLLHGSSIGGARPKALVDGAEAKWIAKFASSNDLYNVVKAARGAKPPRLCLSKARTA